MLEKLTKNGEINVANVVQIQCAIVAHNLKEIKGSQKEGGREYHTRSKDEKSKLGTCKYRREQASELYLPPIEHMLVHTITAVGRGKLTKMVLYANRLPPQCFPSSELGPVHSQLRSSRHGSLTPGHR